MKRILLTVLAPCLPLTAFAQAPPRVTFTASNVLDSGGSSPLASGKLCFVTTDANDRPMGYRVGTGSGQTSASVDQAPCGIVTSGAISPIQIINSAASSPLNACIRVVTLGADGAEIRRSKCVQTGTTDALTSWCSTIGGTLVCNWDQYSIGTTPIALVQQGPKGDKGDTGNNGTDGCVVGDGSCETVVSLNPSTDQNIVQPDGTRLKINSADVLTQNLGEDANLSAVYPYKSLFSVGDSFNGDFAGPCFGASDYHHCGWAVLGTLMKIPESNWTINGLGGTTFSNHAQWIFQHSIKDDGYQLTLHHTSINDCNILGCTDAGPGDIRANAPGMFYSGLLSEALWDLTPDGMKVLASKACTSWSADPTITYGIGAVASTTGTTCTASVKASDIVFVAYMVSMGDGGTARIDVDGGDGAGGVTKTFVSEPATDNVGNPIQPGAGSTLGDTYAPQVVAIPVTFSGDHSIVVTVTSSPSSTFTGTTTSGSDIITGVTPTAGSGLVGDQTFTGPGIPANTFSHTDGCCPPVSGQVQMFHRDTSGNIVTVNATSSGSGTFTTGANAVHLLYFTGNAVTQHPGMPVHLVTGMPSNGHEPFCGVGNQYADSGSSVYDSMTRKVAYDLRKWNYDARWINERATQNGTTVQFTATTFAGSNILAVSSSAGVLVGDALYHTANVPDGSVVTAVNGTQITVSNSATGNGNSASGVSHWFLSNGDCIHPGNNGYGILGHAYAAGASGLTDNTVQSTAPTGSGAVCTQFPCSVAEFHANGQSSSIANTLMTSAASATYRYCANAAVTAYSSTGVSVSPFVTFSGKWSTPQQVAIGVPATRLDNFAGSYIGYDTAKASQGASPVYVDTTSNALYRQPGASTDFFANVLTSGYNCVTFTAKSGTLIYTGVNMVGTNTGGTYAVDATLEQLTKQ